MPSSCENMINMYTVLGFDSLDKIPLAIGVFVASRVAKTAEMLLRRALMEFTWPAHLVLES